MDEDSREADWVRKDFPGKVVHFHNKTAWRLTDLLAIKRSYESDEDDDGTAELSAMFKSEQVGGPKVAHDTVIRVRIQILPRGQKLHPHPGYKAREASKNPSNDTKTEINSLTRLTETGCRYTPKLLSVLQEEQDATMWVPGGWLVFLLIEKLPGVHPPDIYATMTRAQRDEIRAAFKTAILEVHKRKLNPYDKKRGNLLWDAKQKICYIIDFEHCDDCTGRNHSVDFLESDFIRWQLARRNRKTHEIDW